MANASRSKQHVGRAERLLSVAANIFTTAGGDEIDFIARVGILWIGPAWRIDLNQQGALFEDSSEAFAPGDPEDS